MKAFFTEFILEVIRKPDDLLLDTPWTNGPHAV